MTGSARPRTINWNTAPRFGRRPTILRTMERVADAVPSGPRIVETGTLRDSNACESDGWSTIAWGWLADRLGGRLWTVDLDQGALRIARAFTREWRNAIEYVEKDSVAFLGAWDPTTKGTIDLLYLDSLDYVDESRSEIHCMNEAEAALSRLSSTSFVLFDDVRLIGPPRADGLPRIRGKGALAIPWLVGQGFNLEWCFVGQALLSRGAATTHGSSPSIIDRDPQPNPTDKEGQDVS